MECFKNKKHFLVIAIKLFLDYRLVLNNTIYWLRFLIDSAFIVKLLIKVIFPITFAIRQPDKLFLGHKLRKKNHFGDKQFQITLNSNEKQEKLYKSDFKQRRNMKQNEVSSFVEFNLSSVRVP